MARFILLSFGLLAWAFYAMSGGSDFQPYQSRVLDQTATLSTPRETADADTTTREPENPVTLNLTRVDEVLTGGTTQPARIVEPLDEPEDPPVEISLTPTPATTDLPELLPSILDTDTTVSVTTLPSLVEPAPDLKDLRRVSGDRVNVRGGPGTGFDVVFQLLRGDEVEVLEDSGDGWVRMRAVANGDDGWIADFLLE